MCEFFFFFEVAGERPLVSNKLRLKVFVVIVAK
jgi:hypothetical protein